MELTHREIGGLATIIGFVLIAVNALDYLLSANQIPVYVTIIGLILAVVGALVYKEKINF